MILRSTLILAVAVFVLARPPQAQETVTEFPLTMPGGETEHTLAGTVARAKVYAFGLYVDHAAAATALTQWAGRNERALQDDASFYAALLRDNFAKTLRLVMTQDVAGAKISQAFEQALTPRVQWAAKNQMQGGGAALATFRGFFDVPTLTKGSELVFTWLPGGTLHTTIQGHPQPDIPSLALCWALFDVYLGVNPISSGGKKSVIARFPELLAARQ